jgi:hypothetical protein
MIPNIRVVNFPLMLLMPVPLAGKPHPSNLQTFRVSVSLRFTTETKTTWLLSQIPFQFSNKSNRMDHRQKEFHFSCGYCPG